MTDTNKNQAKPTKNIDELHSNAHPESHPKSEKNNNNSLGKDKKNNLEDVEDTQEDDEVLDKNPEEQVKAKTPK
jgi:hypothetical protein